MFMATLIATAAAATLAAAAPTRPGGIALPLQAEARSNPMSLRKRSLGNTTLIAYTASEDLYSVKVNIGFPAQNFRLLVDTASPMSWVWGTCNGEDYCKDATLYDPNKSGRSSDVNMSFQSYRNALDPDVIGNYYSEAIIIGSIEGVVLLGVANATQPEFLPDLPGGVDGVLGLTFRVDDKAELVAEWVDSITEDLPRENKVFGLHIRRPNDTGSTIPHRMSDAGELVVGGYNAALCDGPPNIHNVSQESVRANVSETARANFSAATDEEQVAMYREGQWRLDNVRLTHGGEEVVEPKPNQAADQQVGQPKPAQGIVDSRAYAIVGPEAAIDAWYKAVGVPMQRDSYGSYYYLADWGALNAGMRIGTHDYSINDADMCSSVLSDDEMTEFGLSNNPAGKWCFSALQSPLFWGELPSNISDWSMWVLGQPFLRNVYTVLSLDPHTVGFAKLNTEGNGVMTNATDEAKEKEKNAGTATRVLQPAVVAAAVGAALAMY